MCYHWSIREKVLQSINGFGQDELCNDMSIEQFEQHRDGCHHMMGNEQIQFNGG